MVDSRQMHPFHTFNNKISRQHMADLEQKIAAQRQQINDLHAECERLRGLLEQADACVSIPQTVEPMLQENLALLHALLEYAPAAIGVTDLQGRYLIVNRYLCEGLQRTEDEIIAAPFDAFFPPDVVAQVYDDHAYISASGETVTREYTINLADGIHIFLHTLFPITNARGTLIAFGSISLDITSRKQVEAELRKFQYAVEQSSSSVVITDVSGKIEYVNPWFTQLTGYTLDEIRGLNPRLLKSGYTAPNTYQAMWNAILSGQPWRGEMLNRRKDGSTFWEWAAIAPIVDAMGKITHFVGIKEDITARKQTEIALQQLNSRLEQRVAARTNELVQANIQLEQSFSQLEAAHTALTYSDARNRALLAALPDAIFLFTHDGVVLDVHLGLSFPLPISLAQMIGQNWRTSLPPDLCDYCEQARNDLLATGTMQIFEWSIQNCTYEIRLAPCATDQILAVVRNITNRKQNEVRLHQLAFYDALTGLPNRVRFNEHLEQLRQRSGTDFAMLLIDIDHFKTINDSLGHMMGDQFLVAIAQRLKACLPQQALLARLGGDEFAILLDDVTNDALVSSVADRVQQAFVSPLCVDTAETFVTVSIGIALSTISARPSSDPLRDADIALSQAKAEGRRCTVVFDTAMHLQATTRLTLATDLRRALERQELRVYYQPIIDLSTGYLHGFEALVRWQHPQRGLLPPATFLPLAEEMGLSVAIDRWVLRAACLQMQTWQLEYTSLPPLSMNVNLSANHLMYADLVETVQQVLAETKLPPEMLNLEITESSFIQYPDIALALLEQLRALRVQISLDDFGTGYSSLSYLQRFPITTLKIDRAFVQHVETHAQDRAIIQALVTLAHTLGMTVVTEGAETESHLAHLRTMQCDYAQGYVFAAPLDAATAEACLSKPWQQFFDTGCVVVDTPVCHTPGHTPLG